MSFLCQHHIDFVAVVLQHKLQLDMGIATIATICFLSIALSISNILFLYESRVSFSIFVRNGIGLSMGIELTLQGFFFFKLAKTFSQPQLFQLMTIKTMFQPLMSPSNFFFRVLKFLFQMSFIFLISFIPTLKKKQSRRCDLSCLCLGTISDDYIQFLICSV